MEARLAPRKAVVEEVETGMSETPAKQVVVRTFMTHDMKDEDIEALSTGRDEELRRVMDAINRSRKASPGPLQHVVLYGSRGFGKSFLARRAQIEAGKLDKPPDPLRYVLLPEEQHNLQRSPHAFLDAIAFKLADLDAGDDNAYEAAHFKWPKPGEKAKRWDEAAARLETATDTALAGGRGLVVVVVENFDTLVASLFKESEDEQRLRAWLDRAKNRVMVFATATGTMDMDYERPLFKAFEPVRLSPWTPDDCIAYFNRLREREGRAPLDGEQEAKARAIAQFIGGTPRLAQLLAEVLDTQEALTVAETMTALADRLADYYRRRIEDLPPLGIGLLDALIRGGEPASQTELAERVEADGQNVIARAMDDLQTADIVRGRKAPDSRETLYSVTDRVFVHYYRLRQHSRAAQETPLASILDFLKSFYSRDEQREQALRHLQAGRFAEAGLFSRLAMEGEASPTDGYTLGFPNRLKKYLVEAPDALGAEVTAIVSMLRDKPESAYEFCRKKEWATPFTSCIASIIRAHALILLGHTNNAQTELHDSVAMAEGDSVATVIALRELTIFLDVIVHDRRAAAEAGLGLQSQSTDNRVPPSLKLPLYLTLAWSLGELTRHEEAIEIADNAIALAKQFGQCREYVVALSYKATYLGKNRRYEEAIEIGDQLIALGKENGDNSLVARELNFTAKCFRELGRHEEAWARAVTSISMSRTLDNRDNFTWAAMEAVLAATNCSRSEAVLIYREWVEMWRSRGGSEHMADPALWLEGLFVAGVRAHAFAELDALLEEHGRWLATAKVYVGFGASQGDVLARIAESEGRAAAFEAIAGLLPRIAVFVAKLPKDKRDDDWLPDFISGFAGACRDPGLLHDVATLLTDDLAPNASESAALLLALAEVDEAKTPELALARMDPDMATLIRRLRDLPDLPPIPPKRRAARARKRQE